MYLNIPSTVQMKGERERIIKGEKDGVGLATFRGLNKARERDERGEKEGRERGRER